MKRPRGYLGPIIFLVLATALLVAVACGPAATPTPTPAPTPTPTPTKPPPTPTPTVAAVATPTPTPTRAAPTPTATPPPVVIVPKGTLTAVTGGTGVGTPSGWPTDCLWCASLVMVGAQEGLLMIDKAADGSWTVAPWLAESWTTAPDFKYTDFKLRKGVTFSKGFGDFTADDVVYTFNAGDPAVTKEARHDTLPNASIAKVEALDKYTFRINWTAYSGATLFDLTDFNESVGIFPKKAADEKGAEWMRTNYTGTGPFEMEEWTAGKGMFLKARTEHWRKVPYFDRFRLLDVPESSTRRAMLESGEASIGDPDIKDWSALIDKGYKKSPEGAIDMWQVLFGGQYWEEKHYVTGVPLNRKLDTTKAWIGNPFGPGCNYDDFKATKPAGAVCDSMEKPRKVRWALAMSVDREGINASILKNLGRLSYLAIPQDDPFWKANADRWKIPYDPKEAKKLMTEAGFSGGFTLGWWVGPSGVGVEMGEAIAAGWLADLNVKVEFDRRAYSAMRPAMVERTANFFQMRNLGNTNALWLGEWIYSSHVPTGYNHAFEVPKASEIYYTKLKTTDVKELTRLTTEWWEYHRYWMLAPTVVQTPGNALYNGKVIADWPMRPVAVTRLSGIRNVEYIKPVP